MVRGDMRRDKHDRYDEVPPSIIGFANQIRLSKDGTKYVYNCDEEADPNSEGKTAIDIANEQLQELKRLKETQVLNMEALLNKGSRMLIGAILLKVGNAFLDKSESEVAMMKMGNDGDSIVVAAKGSKNCKELLKRLRGMIS